MKEYTETEQQGAHRTKEQSSGLNDMLQSQTLHLFMNAIQDQYPDDKFTYAAPRFRFFLSESIKLSFGNREHEVYEYNGTSRDDEKILVILVKNESSRREQSIDFMVGAFLHLTPLGVVYLMYLDVSAAVFNLNNDTLYSYEDNSGDPEVSITFNIIALIMNVIYNLIIDVLLYPVLVISFCIRLFNQVNKLGFGEDMPGTSDKSFIHPVSGYSFQSNQNDENKLDASLLEKFRARNIRSTTNGSLSMNNEERNGDSTDNEYGVKKQEDIFVYESPMKIRSI